MDRDSPLTRNYGVCQEVQRRATALVSQRVSPGINDYREAVESVGLAINTLAEDSGRGHDIYGVFYGPPFTQGLEPGVLLAILDDDRVGAVPSTLGTSRRTVGRVITSAGCSLAGITVRRPPRTC